MTSIALCTGNDISYATGVNDESDFSWQRIHHVSHFSWQAQYLVPL